VRLVVAVVLVAVAVTGSRLAGHRASPRKVPRPAGAVTNLHHRLLGVTARWELLGWGPSGVVRIQLARGRITQTPIPPLASTGPVSFVVTPTLAIVRPLDFVSGYEVANQRPSRLLPGLLGQGGPLIPGPDPAHLWVVPEGLHHAVMTLVGLDGQPAGASVQLPANDPMSVTATTDGRGYALLAGTGGVYDTGPSGLRWVAGSIAAVGPARWLGVTCQHRTHCRDEVIDTARGTDQRLPGPALRGPAWPPGVISPDGSQAAVFTAHGDGKTRLSLINLSNGASRGISVPINEQSLEGQMLAWSPDGKWLFAVAAHGRLAVISARTGRVTSLGAALPPLAQIAIRDTAS
jgi:hypothetical protein